MSNKTIIKPPWKTSNQHQNFTGGMGGVDPEWFNWLKALDENERKAYIAQYPEPEDWFFFYRLYLLPTIDFSGLIEECNNDPRALPENFLAELYQSRFELIEQAERLRTRYCNLHFELALVHEEAGHIQQAVEHLGKVIFNIRRYEVWIQEKREDAEVRYQRLKSLLAKQMALNPIIRKSWSVLEADGHRKSLSLKKMTITLEEYARLQHNVFYPSERGHTWIHCIENGKLYIHRHWDEPCLFLIVLEPEEQSYQIVEAWMNNDSTIPLNQSPMKPEILLGRLLNWLMKG